MANQSGPESCVTHREMWGEALTGETGGPAIEPRNQEIGMPMLLSEAEGNMAGHLMSSRLRRAAEKFILVFGDLPQSLGGASMT